MSHLLYVANVRMPTEKAHGYQIVQMCEAFALTGQAVTLVVPRRFNTPELREVGGGGIAAYYGVRDNFRVIYLPCLDFIAFFPQSRLAFFLQTLSFLIVLLLWLPFQRYDHLFSRDALLLAPLVWLIPRRKIIYEVHSKARSGRMKRLQNSVMRRTGKVISLTASMAVQLQKEVARDYIIAHDGVRPERFATYPNISQIRAELGIQAGAFVACYAGRLHTMGMGKGLETFVDAAAKAKNITFLLVGGPAEHVEDLRRRWRNQGLPEADFIAVGTVPPADVPRYLAAADVCLITSPYNEFFAHETSPMKLFEYMMAGKAIIASELPSTTEILWHEESAYLVPPSDVGALARALIRLREDEALRKQLGETAQQAVLAYTWVARAEKILSAPPEAPAHAG